MKLSYLRFVCDPPLDLVAGAGMEGCVEGPATFFADLPCQRLKKPHSRPLLAEFSPAGGAALQHVAGVEELVVLLPLWLLHDQHHIVENIMLTDKANDE